MRSKADKLDPALAVLVALPPFIIGGAPSWVIPPFATGALAVLAWRWRKGGDARRPRGWWLGVVAALWTVVAVLPWGSGLASSLAPGPTALADRSRALIGSGPWPCVSVLPGATLLEAARIAGLSAVFVLAANASWRRLSALVSAVGLCLLTLGLLQLAIGGSSLLGIYEPRHVSLEGATYSGILTPFINPNHYGAFCLLAAASSWALVVDDDESRGMRHDARVFFAVATALNLLGLMLSQSRGAMLCAGLAVPAALLFGRSSREPARGPKRALPSLPWVLAVLAALALLALAGRDAWLELRSLGDEGAIARKFESVSASLQLVGGAPITGTGRGSSVDLLGTVFRERGVLIFTHIESAPIAALVEWGPILGSAFVLGCLGLFAGAWSRARSTGRRVLLVGLAAWAVENCGDFNWEMLGTTTPAVALLGALSPRDRRPLPARRGRVSWLLMASLAAASWFGAPHTWSQLRRQDRSVAAGELGAQDALARRPLDARVHLLLAREAHEGGAFELAADHARFAAELAPWSVDAQTLLATLFRREGDMRATTEALRTALAVVRHEEREALVTWLCSAWPPEVMRDAAPASERAFSLAAMAMLGPCPAHADALATEPALADTPPLIALEVRTRANVELGRPLLARHYGRLWAAAAPEDARAQVWYARAMRRSPPDAESEELSRARLVAALKAGVDEPAVVEEAILRSLLNASTPAQRASYLERFGSSLLQRPGDRVETKRRRQLVEQLQPRG